MNESTREPMSLNESGDTSGYIKYMALYDFDSRNPDELPFKAGDIIMVNKLLAYKLLEFFYFRMPCISSS